MAAALARLERSAGYAASIVLILLALSAYWLAGTLPSLWWLLLVIPGALFQTAGFNALEAARRNH